VVTKIFHLLETMTQLEGTAIITE